jgi:hypothetical protein
MKVYAVFEPRRRGDDLSEHAERFKFVRDGFSFAAFIFGPLWMLRHRLWLAFVGYLVIVALLATAAYVRALPVGAELAIIVILALLIGLEAATLRRRKLLWWRWHDAGVVVADDLVGAEQRFFDRWVARAPMTQTPDIAPTVVATPEPAPPAVPPPVPTPSETAPAEPATPARAYDPDSYVVGQFPRPGETR